jgi:hypothetical protein
MHPTTRSLARLLVAGVAAVTAPLAMTSAATASAAPAAPAVHQLNTQATAVVKPMVTWFSGTMAAGASSSWVWNNAGATRAYTVSLSPVGASTTTACQFEVTRSWDVQQASGEREFHWIIKNVGTIACGTNVMLSSIVAANTWQTGGINAGASKSMTWNHANPKDTVYLPGLNPSGATSTASCQLEVTRRSYVDKPDGEREFHFTVKNAGTIACQGTVLLAQRDAGNGFNIGPIGTGNTGFYEWHNAPTNYIFIVGLTPNGATATTSCELEITRDWYVQQIKADGTFNREVHFNVKNTGSTISCSAVAQLAFYAA